MFSIAIIGLPNAGKSTLFRALTQKQVAIAPYPFTTIEPNTAQVPVPDPRLEELAALVKPQKTTPTVIEFVDIAGLVKDAHKGEGLGNQFLAQIQGCEAILEVIRGFEKTEVEHPEKTIDPQRDQEIIREELIRKDLELATRAIARHQKELKAGSKEKERHLPLLEKIREGLSRQKKISELALSPEELSTLPPYQFLTQKPFISLLNTGPEKRKVERSKGRNVAVLDLKWEEEVAQLSKEEQEDLEAPPLLDRIILKCYDNLELITFYTIAGGRETSAWSLKRGERAVTAANKVHSDFAKKFIRAEVIPFAQLVKAGSWQKAREEGLVKTVGRDYEMEDGDIIEFKV